MFLADEINLAEGRVLERMKSVLGLEGKILLSGNLGEEGAETERIVATKGFQFVVTMNLESDFEKKELSPALKNRFIQGTRSY